VGKSKSKPKPYRFKGWDWTEVLTALGEPTGDEGKYAADKLRQIVSDALSGKYGPGGEASRKKVLRAARGHAKAMSKAKACYDAPLWRGLSDVTDDDTFLIYFRDLFPAMWS
jgi:hypothetical protein